MIRAGLCCLCLAIASCSGTKTSTPSTTSPSAEARDVVPPEPEPEPEVQDSLYQATFGEGVQPFVFLHGGPGYNSALFEATTANPLSELGPVTVYDRRGTGRSAEQANPPKFTFDEAFADLDRVLEGLEQPVLLAHSFGGAVALRYLDARPDFDGTVVLINAPISYPRSLATIIANCRVVYEANEDVQNLSYLDQLEAMDPASAQYAGFAFTHGLSCGLYRPRESTEHAQALSKQASTHPAAALFGDSKPGPFVGFHAAEHYTTLDLSESVGRHAARIWGIYGEEDRIISDEDRTLLREALGARYVAVPGAAHNVFVDAQPEFLESLGVVIAKQ